ncbi:hypothetical protein [Alteromonas oceanisediminis]|uniref:hypothetical protein n=1 Tax=Alteromonas oceanisediminis TaxID=2836180 RepID=UPI001BDA2CC8|nr:hypothetical protein [Alteromonas oceanisediminis]MBT0586998.1 hypothetical protein [Alteromonas oceanisediminis]
MKYIAIIALSAVLAACSGGASDESVKAAEAALGNISQAKSMLASVNSVPDAQKLEADFAEIGQQYASAMKALNSADQGDMETAQALAQVTPKIAMEYQGMMAELNALQARNSDAAQVLIDELKAFRP